MVKQATLVTLALLVACGDPGQRSPHQTSAVTDTLLGLRLGMLLPDVRDALKQDSILLDCSNDGESFQWCTPTILLYGERGSFFIGFNEGRLVFVDVPLSSDWSFVPLDTLLLRLSPYGHPEAADSSEDRVVFTWFGPPDSTMFRLSCALGNDGRECTRWVQYGTPEDLEEEAAARSVASNSAAGSPEREVLPSGDILDAIERNPSSYIDQTIEIDSVQVASALSSELFWTTTSNRFPILIRFRPQQLKGDVRDYGGRIVALSGRVKLMTDSVLEAWQDSGMLSTPDQIMEAEFATFFIDATLIEVRR